MWITLILISFYVSNNRRVGRKAVFLFSPNNGIICIVRFSFSFHFHFTTCTLFIQIFINIFPHKYRTNNSHYLISQPHYPPPTPSHTNTDFFPQGHSWFFKNKLARVVVASSYFSQIVPQAALRSPREDVGWGVEVRRPVGARGLRHSLPRAGAQLSASVRGKVSGLCILLFLINLIVFKFNKEHMNLRVFLSARL